MVCRHAGRGVLIFVGDSRGGRDVWVCWERCRPILGTVLPTATPKKDAEGQPAAASQLELEPAFPVYLDLATEEPEDLGCFLDPKSGGTPP